MVKTFKLIVLIINISYFVGLLFLLFSQVAKHFFEEFYSYVEEVCTRNPKSIVCAFQYSVLKDQRFDNYMDYYGFTHESMENESVKIAII